MTKNKFEHRIQNAENSNQLLSFGNGLGRRFSKLIGIAVLLCSFFVLNIAGADELTDQVSDKKKEILIIESKISDQERKIEELKSQEQSIYNEIQLLDAEQEKTQMELDAAQMQLDQVNLDIQDILGQIDQTQKDLDIQVEVFKEHVNETYIQSRTSFLEVMVEADTMSELLRKVEYLEIMDEQNEQILIDLNAIRSYLEDQKSSLDQKRSQIEELKQQVLAKQDEINEQMAVKQTLLAETQSLEANYQGIIDANLSARQQLESEIRNIEAEIRRKIEEERQKQIQEGGVTIPTTPSRQGYIWPTSGKITMYFWEKYPDWMLQAYKWLNNSNYMYHTGLDIAAGLGTPIVAPKAGTVVYTNNFGNIGYGRMIMLDHGDGAITLFGHLNSTSVSQGAVVIQGQQIGTMGSSGFSTGSHLHFEVRENGKLVDPLVYLP